jgi:hypothetical protein
MGQINYGRVVVGGLVAGVVMNRGSSHRFGDSQADSP